jgi:hypothetical protein
MQPEDLNSVKNRYPHRELKIRSLLNKMQDPLWRELYNEVQNKHKDFSPLQSETEDLLSM